MAFPKSSKRRYVHKDMVGIASYILQRDGMYQLYTGYMCIYIYLYIAETSKDDDAYHLQGNQENLLTKGQ